MFQIKNILTSTDVTAKVSQVAFSLDIQGMPPRGIAGRPGNS